MRHLLAISALLAACGSGDAPAPSAPTPSTAPAPSPAPVGPNVPSVTDAWTVAPPPEPWLVVARDSISLGAGPPIARLVDARVAPADRDGLVIRPLREHLTSAPAPSRAIGIAIDPAISFRTVSEVVLTLGQAERTDLSFVVRRDGVAAALPLVVPRAHEAPLLGALDPEGALADVLAGGAVDSEGPSTQTPAAPIEPTPVEPPASEVELEDASTLNLSVTVTARGLVIAASGGFLAPGCARVAPSRGVTVPPTGDAQDLAALTRCLASVHAEFPEEDGLIVSADPDVPFGHVAGVIAASRGTPERPLFPRTLMAVGFR